MRAPRSTSPRPSVGHPAPVDVRALQSRLQAMSKRDAVAYLIDRAGVSRSWAERHLKRLHRLTLAEFADALILAAHPAFLSQLRTFDPTGDTAVRNIEWAGDAA